MGSAEDVQPSVWTLKCKYGRITVLLFTDAAASIATLKEELLEAIGDRYPDGLEGLDGEKTAIPSTADAITLAALVDEHDPEKGWSVLDGPELEGVSTAKALGLKDGATLAFAFGPVDELDTSKFAVEFPAYNDEEFEQEAP